MPSPLKMKLAALLICALLPMISVAGTPATGPLDDAAIRQLIENAEELPGQDAVVLFQGRYFNFSDDLVEMRVQKLIRIQSDWALEHVSDPVITFDSARQELQVHAARTYYADGYYQDSPANAFNELTPGPLALAVDFLSIRDMIVSHVGLEVGRAIWLDYTLKDLSPSALPFTTVIFPQGEFPILRSEIVADGLFGLSVNPASPLFRVPDPVSSDDRLTWSLEHIPALPGEAAHRLGEQTGYLTLSAVETLEELAAAIYDNIDGAAEINVGLEEWLTTFEDETPFLTDREALATWAEALNHRTALVGVHGNLLSAGSRPVTRILTTSSATPLERVTLLMACCRSRGIEAWPVLPARWLPGGNSDLPALDLLASPLVKIWNRERSTTLLVDPVRGRILSRQQAEEYPMALELASAGTPDATRIWAPSIYPPQTGGFTLKVYWNLDDGSCSAEGFFPLYPGLEGDAGKPESLLRNWVESWGDSVKLDRLQITATDGNGIEFNLTANFPVPPPGERERIGLDLPLPPRDLARLIPGGMNLAHSGCRAILFPRDTVPMTVTWILDLPPSRPLLTLGNRGLDFPGASFTLERIRSENRLMVNYSLHPPAEPVSPAEYPMLRNFLLEVLDPVNTSVILGQIIPEQE
jgi:hypothetical protein